VEDLKTIICKRKNIFFDADGVLFASEDFEESIFKVLKKYDFERNKIKEKINNNIHQMYIPNKWIDTFEQEEEMWRDLFGHIILGFQIDDEEIVIDDLLKNAVYYKNSYLLEGVNKFLETYKNTFDYYVITNSYPSVYYVLNHLGIDKYFKKVISSSDIHMCKPNKEIFKYAITITGCKAEESYFVDDNVVNIEAANNVGMKGILLDNRKGEMRRLVNILT